MISPTYPRRDMASRTAVTRRSPQRRLRAATWVLLALGLWAPAAAQDAIRSAGAGGRFEVQHDAKTRTAKFDAATLAAFRRQFDPMVARIEAMPAVNQPSVPLCMRSTTWIEIVGDAAIGASQRLLRPLVQNGRCSKTTGEGVMIELNMLSMLRRKDETESELGPTWWRLPISDFSATGFRLLDNGSRYEVMTHGRAPLFRSVTMEQYLKRRAAKLSSTGEGAYNAYLLSGADRTRTKPGTVSLLDGPAEIRKALQRLSAEDLARPVCVMEDGWAAPRECPLADQVLEENPAYFDRRKPAAVQLVVLQTPDEPQRFESAIEAAERLRIMEAIDRAPLRAMIE